MHIWNVDAVTGLISDELSEKRLGRKDAKEGAARGTARARPHDNARVFSKAGRQRRGRASDSS